jgi:hypothetical protein
MRALSGLETADNTHIRLISFTQISVAMEFLYLDPLVDIVQDELDDLYLCAILLISVRNNQKQLVPNS